MLGLGRVGAVAIALLAAVPAAPAHAAGSYTHVVCADAATGGGVDADGRLPSGMTSTSGHTVGADAATATRCSGRVTASTGCRSAWASPVPALLRLVSEPVRRLW